MMFFSVGDGQLSLANATQTTGNKHATVQRVRVWSKNLLHFLDFGLAADEEIIPHVRGIEVVQPEGVF
jgi:hypothetical protein